MYERVRQWMWEMREWEKKERVRAGLLCSNFRAWPKVISSHINEIKRSVACQDFQGAPFQWWMNPFIAWIRFNVYFHFGFILLIVISNSQFGVWPIWFNSTKRQHEKKSFPLHSWSQKTLPIQTASSRIPWHLRWFSIFIDIPKDLHFGYFVVMWIEPWILIWKYEKCTK